MTDSEQEHPSTFARSRRIVLVDDHPVVLEGLRELLRTVEHFTVVAAVGSGHDAIAAIAEHHPDLAVLDLRLPDVAAPDLCAAIKERSPDTKMLIFTAFDDRPLLRACIEAGANGALLKDQSDIIASIERVLSGERVIDPRVEVALEQQPADDGSPPSLTPRELEVLRLVERGLTSREMAKELHLSPNTVRSYTQTILTKLGAHNRIQALTRAREMDLL